MCVITCVYFPKLQREPKWLSHPHVDPLNVCHARSSRAMTGGNLGLFPVQPTRALGIFATCSLQGKKPCYGYLVVGVLPPPEIDTCVVTVRYLYHKP